MIVTITGPSCAGKSTLEAMLNQHGFGSAISTTTRPMRKGEIDGESYYFISREAFERNASAGAYIETVNFGGNYYGISASEMERLLATGNPIAIVIEPKGQKQIDKFCKDRNLPIFSVFVDNPESVIAERFLTRLTSEVMNNASRHESEIVASYATRLATMMTVERTWVAEAYCAHDYDLILPEFSEANSEDVIGIIINNMALKETT
jgi:guanylate kinase